MIKKICDNCKSEMDIDNSNFRIEINPSNDEITEFYADLCEKCEKDLINGIKTTLKSYGIDTEEEIGEVGEDELNEDSY